MSTTIDNKVVEMRFDNKQFESGVQTSLSTLEKLKQSLNLTGASKGLESVNSAANKINFSTLGNAVETVQSKFSALEVMGVTALVNLTNSAVNAGKRIASALTIEPVKTGFSEYETQINAVQTILSNTRTKGTTLDDVNGALDQLNTYADKTIYNFTEMTRNIGTFTAAGVDLDTSVSSIKGIANLAAVSGSSSQQASTAMYQLSQALAAGKVSLMDWNSVVNAGMGGQVFQDALKRTATNMGHDVDGMIEKYGSFRESLTKGEWLTSEVLTETLTQLSGAYSKADLIAQGYTESQAKEILALADDAENAATKVKTVTQLWDTLKEAAQSGWTQTWEIIVGDFEEARELLTKVSDTIGGMIGASAESRNNLLQGWKDAGGRTDLIDAMANSFEALMNIVKPIKEAFSEIFPPLTVDQLVNFTKGLKDLTDKFKTFTEEQGPKIKDTFKGIFAVLDIGVTFVKELASGALDLLGYFSGLGSSVLGATGSFGDWLVSLRDNIKETDILGKTIGNITGFLGTCITKVKEFIGSIKSGFKSPGFDTFANVLESIWNIIKQIGSKIGEIGSAIGSEFTEAFGNLNLGDGLATINTGLLGGILLSVHNFTKGLSDSVGDVLENVVGILDDVRGCFQAYQDQLKAETLKKIATAIAILAGAIFIIALIDADAMDRAIGGITLLFAELLGSLSIFTKISSDMGNVAKACIAMESIAVAALILGAAMKIMGSMSWDEIAHGLIGLGGGLGTMVAAINLLPEKNIYKAAKAIGKLSVAMVILGAAMKIMGSMSWNEMGVALTGIVVGLGALVAAVNLLPKDAALRSAGMIGLATSMVILGVAMKIMGSMSWDEIAHGLVALGGALGTIVLAMNFMPNNLPLTSVGLLGVATALVILGGALKIMGSMSWDGVAKSLVTLAISLGLIAGAMSCMTGALPGAAALLIVSTALAIFTPVLLSLGAMSWESIAKGLIAIAGAFAVIGIAGLLLQPILPAIVGLAGSLALMGLAALGIGAGLTLIGVGITAISIAFGTLVGSISAAATALVAGLSIIIVGVAKLIPTLIDILGEAILSLCNVITECAPAIADTILIVITEVLASLAKYTPQIAGSILDFLIDILAVLAEKLPELIKVAVDVIGAFFQGVVDALSGIDVSSLLKGIVGIGLLTALMYALSGVAALVPSAMVGVLGMGVLIAELALVLAAIGALAQIPGLKWLIEEGGDFLQSIGTAIGQFVGGIIGGLAEGMVASLPQIGTDLSTFMTNLEPFIKGAKSIDASMMEGVNMLAETILILTKAELLDGLTSFLTGGSSLSDFGSELGAFGTSLNSFVTNLGTFDETKVATVTCAVNAVKAMAEAASSINGQAEWTKALFGDNSLAAFGSELPSLGSYLNQFATNLGAFGEDKLLSVTNAGKAIKAMADAASSIDGQAEWAKTLFGDNSIVAFGADLPSLGTYLNQFATNLGTFDDKTVATVTCAGSAVKALADASASIDGQAEWTKALFGDNGLATFGSELGDFGSSMNAFVTNLGTFDETKVATVNCVVKAVTALAGLADADLKNAKKYLTDFSGKLDDFAIDITAFCSEMPSGEAVSIAVASIKKIMSMINDISGADTTIVSNFTKALNDLGKSGIDSFVNAFTSSSAKADVKDAAIKLVEQAIKGAESKKKTIKEAFSDLAEAGASSIKEQKQDFYNAGLNLVSGFANGIDENTWEAEAKAEAMAKAALKAAEEALGIASPSKEAYAIGDFTGQGFVKALGDFVSKSYNAGYDIASSAKEGLRCAISRIGDAINSDIDAQPTIRPVLDLSDVTSGANAISNMLSMNPSIGTLSNARAISSMMGQNGKDNDVVSAINKLRKDLGNVGGTTNYTINGVTYDDGSNVSGAVKSLIRAAKIERRV